MIKKLRINEALKDDVYSTCTDGLKEISKIVNGQDMEKVQEFVNNQYERGISNLDLMNLISGALYAIGDVVDYVNSHKMNESLIKESHDIDEAETLADSLIGMEYADACRELRNSGYDETEYGMVGVGTYRAGGIEYSTYSNPEDDFEIVIRYRLEKGEGNRLLNSEIIDAYVLDYRE